MIKVIIIGGPGVASLLPHIPLFTQPEIPPLEWTMIEKETRRFIQVGPSGFKHRDSNPLKFVGLVVGWGLYERDPYLSPERKFETYSIILEGVHMDGRFWYYSGQYNIRSHYGEGYLLNEEEFQMLSLKILGRQPPPGGCEVGETPLSPVSPIECPSC